LLGARGKGIAQLDAAFAELRFESRDKESVFRRRCVSKNRTPIFQSTCSIARLIFSAHSCHPESNEGSL